MFFLRSRLILALKKLRRGGRRSQERGRPEDPEQAWVRHHSGSGRPSRKNDRFAVYTGASSCVCCTVKGVDRAERGKGAVEGVGRASRVRQPERIPVAVQRSLSLSHSFPSFSSPPLSLPFPFCPASIRDDNTTCNSLFLDPYFAVCNHNRCRW